MTLGLGLNPLPPGYPPDPAAGPRPVRIQDDPTYHSIISPPVPYSHYLLGFG